jgi:hypoxanthine phosphoribosyltransferase
MVDKLHYTWGDVETAVNIIDGALKCDNWKPDHVIGLVRGGMIPAIMLSHKIGVPCSALAWSKRDYSTRDHGMWFDYILKMAISQHRKFLIVDDILDTGETLEELKHYANHISTEPYWSNYVKFAVLHKNVACRHSVDYWVSELDKSAHDTWVVYPWEV